MQDPILLWNQVALDANALSHTNVADRIADEQTGPTSSSRAMAIVHLAMYDAFAGISNDAVNLPRYLSNPTAPTVAAADLDANLESAVAAAAHTALSALYPSQKLIFDAALPASGTLEPAHSFGVSVAQAILADRAKDRDAKSPGYVAKPGRGKHRVDPEHPSQGFHGAFYGKNAGFGITERFELAPPPFGSEENSAEQRAEYEAAVKQVRREGIAPELMGTLPNGVQGRTVDQTLIGIYWAYDGMAKVGTPPRQYNQIVREIAMNKINPATGQINGPAENARLFAFVNVAMADAGVLAWQEKYKHDLWRPVLGVREHDVSMGPASPTPRNNIDNDCDPQWLPLGAPRSNRVGKNPTPPFPAYPSGHATFGAAAFHITRLFYGEGGKFGDNTLDEDNLFDGLSFVSDEFNGVTTDNKETVRPRHVRNFPGSSNTRSGLLGMIEENGLSRVYLGVHWIFDAFVMKNKKPDFQRHIEVDNKKLYFGGVPLGLQIAEDVFDAGDKKAPKKSIVGPMP